MYEDAREAKLRIVSNLSRAGLSRHHIEKTRARRRSDFQSPQTVLKTAGRRSTDVRQRPQQFSWKRRQSMSVHIHAALSAALAVFLAVSDPT